jgi:hypothetical protein
VCVSAIKLVKTRLQNKIGDGFLIGCLIICIEKYIAIEFTPNSFIDGINAINITKYDSDEAEVSSPKYLFLTASL